MCLILAVVNLVFRQLLRGESVYGDQGQEVAREVRQKHRVTKREQESLEGQEIGWTKVCVGTRSQQPFAQRDLRAFRSIGPELRELWSQQARRELDVHRA